MARTKRCSLWRHLTVALAEWAAVICDLRHNPLVGFERTAQLNHVPSRCSQLRHKLARWLAQPRLRFPLFVLLLLLLMGYGPLCYIHIVYPDSPSWIYAVPLQPWLMLAYLIALLPAAYCCAGNALQFLAQRQRSFPLGSVVDETLALSQLSDKEILAGFVFTRLAPLWRLAAWFTVLSTSLILLTDWLHFGANFITLIAAVILSIRMLFGLWLAALLWFLYHLCLGCALPRGLASSLALGFMLFSQVALWAWMYLTDSGCGLPCGSTGILGTAGYAALNVALLVIALALSRKWQGVRFGIICAAPVLFVLPHLLRVSELLAASPQHTGMDAVLASDYYPFVLSGYSLGYTYIPSLISSLMGYSNDFSWLAPCSLLLLAQLIQVPIVVYFATRAVHARRQRPA